MVKLCETIAVSPEEMRHAYCNAPNANTKV